MAIGRDSFAPINIYGPPIVNSERKEIAKTRIASYRASFTAKLRSQLLSPESTFKITCTNGLQEHAPAECILDILDSERRVFLQGYAGSGKSALLGRLASMALNRNMIPVILNLKHFKGYVKQFREVGNHPKQKLDILLKVSLMDLSIELFEDLELEKMLVLIDGLNEVPAGEFGEDCIREIVELFGDISRVRLEFVNVLVADRMVRRQFLEIIQPPWHRLSLDLLDDGEVRENFVKAFSVEKYDALKPQGRELLKLPFFLNLALTSKRHDWTHASAAFEDFFKKVVDLDEKSLDTLASAAYLMYERYRSRLFVLKDFAGIIENSILEKLFGAGILKQSGEHIEFDHQLKHDYLVSRHLARNQTLWSEDAFDYASFDASSFEALEMVLEQLDQQASADSLLKKLYDWNWRITLSAMAWASKNGKENYSVEIKTAILAVLSIKLFDKVQHTRSLIQSFFTDLPGSIADQFIKSAAEEEILEHVRIVVPTSDWFKQFQEIFTKTPASHLTEEEVNLIASPDSIIGWTMSNVIKRFEETSEVSRQLRTIYNYSREKSNATVRWRVVHSLGAFGSKENAQLLLKALKSDDYQWTRYGSARSLVEMAATTSDLELRSQIIAGLKEQMHNLPKNILEEIGRTAFYRGARGSWKEDMIPLFENIRDNMVPIADREKWKLTITKFKTSSDAGA